MSLLDGRLPWRAMYSLHIAIKTASAAVLAAAALMGISLED